MDIFTNLQSILGAVVLVIFYNAWRARKNKQKLKAIMPPEVSGGLPIIGHLHQLGTHNILARTFAAMAEKNGDIFTLRIGTHRAVVVSSYEALKEWFTTNDKALAGRPASSQAKHLGYNYVGFGFLSYGPYYSEIRKLTVTELLSVQRIKSLRHVQIFEANSFMKDLYSVSKFNGNNQNNPAKVVISQWLETFTLNTITKLISGKRYVEKYTDVGIREGDGDRSFGDVIKDFMFIVAVFVPQDLIPFLKGVDFKGNIKAMKRIAAEIDVIMETWIQEHKLKRLNNDSIINEDFIDDMLSLIKDDAPFGHKRETVIKATSLALIIAGFHATSIALIWIMSVLLNHRDVLKRAQEELDLKVGRERLVEDSDIDNLVYIQAVIKETLRLYPPGPLAFPHEASEDCYLNGYFIPKGTRMFPNFWKLHRDPKLWCDPEEFRPERFLTTNANVDVVGQDFEFLPFGSGRRTCPGRNLAMYVLHLMIPRLLQGFDWTTPMNEPVDMTEEVSVSLPKQAPLQVVVTPRLAPKFYQ